MGKSGYVVQHRRKSAVESLGWMENRAINSGWIKMRMQKRDKWSAQTDTLRSTDVLIQMQFVKHH